MAAVVWQGERVEGHDERVERRSPLRLVTAPPSRRRPSAAVYRRRRLVALVLALGLVALVAQAGLGVVRASSSAGVLPEKPVVLVAEPGDSYWSLASEVYEGGDIRSVVDALVDANGGGELRAGDRITLRG